MVIPGYILLRLAFNAIQNPVVVPDQLFQFLRLLRDPDQFFENLIAETDTITVNGRLLDDRRECLAALGFLFLVPEDLLKQGNDLLTGSSWWHKDLRTSSVKIS